MFHDLYRENFNPVIPKEELESDQTKDSLVAFHQQEIREADGIIIVHPNWWGPPPAILTSNPPTSTLHPLGNGKLNHLATR